MRIGIDGRALRGFIEGSRAGVGRYVFELCRQLDELMPEARFFVYSPVEIELPIVSERWQLRVDPSPVARRLKPVLWVKMRAGAMCAEDTLDVFWGSATFLPRLGAVPSVMTVYDLNHLVVPDTMSWTHRMPFELFFARDLRRADVVTAISRGTADRVSESYGVAVDSIVYPCAAELFQSLDPQAARQWVAEKFDVRDPYLLAVATWEPRKNLAFLIDVVADLKAAGELPAHRLVLVGGRGWKDRRVAELAGKYPWVMPLGYVDDGDLPALYAGSDLFLYPSVYEGFGIPLLEARVCGARILANDTPELREAGGSDGTYAPIEGGAFKAAIRGLVECGRTGGDVDVDWPSWADSAQILRAALTTAAGR